MAISANRPVDKDVDKDDKPDEGKKAVTPENVTNAQLVRIVWEMNGSPFGSEQEWLNHLNEREMFS